MEGELNKESRNEKYLLGFLASKVLGMSMLSVHLALK